MSSERETIRRRKKFFVVRLTEAEKEQARQAADRSSLSLSAWMRMLIVTETNQHVNREVGHPTT